ncbi:MAG TPA: hypothetical protein VIL97_00715 [Thermoanaerobaculia bacterium]
MTNFFEKSSRFLDLPLRIWPRVLLLIAAILVIPVYTSPLWNLTMFAPQYSDGLRLDIYSYKLVGGNDGQDVKEINILNHYIGMRDLVASDFTEFKWIPFVVGAMALLFLRTAVLGKVAQLVDVFVIFIYFGAFSLWSFAYKLWSYGHHLAPNAAVKVDPFMPPLFGYRKIANFEIYSYPGAASYALFVVTFALAVALFLTWRDARALSIQELRSLT